MKWGRHAWSLLCSSALSRTTGSRSLPGHTHLCVRNLNRKTENELEQAVRSLIPGVQPDGSFALLSRALAVAGVKA